MVKCEPEHGTDHSAYSQGKAACIQITDNRDRVPMLPALPACGFTRIGLYHRYWIQGDVGEEPAEGVWVE